MNAEIDYFKGLSRVMFKVEINNRSGKPLLFDKSIAGIVDFLCGSKIRNNRVIFIGNGGSASIASHMATDFLKNAAIPALVFSDSSLITCLTNDLGYEHVFRKPIELLANKGDILFAISSSGASKNILSAVNQARKKGCFIITLSGFNKNNPLRKSGDINFYLPSFCYGHVEIGHLIICHSIADKLMEAR